MKILIDGRLYGLENAGLGRYTLNLISELSHTDKANEYVVLLRKKYYKSLNLPSNWKKVLADFRHYSLKEQIKLPGIIKRESPDVTHFPHFNVPLFLNINFVVTIHDMLMHKSFGLSATTLPPIQYFIKRLGYRLIFNHAVEKSKFVIAPSKTVAEEIEKTYKLPPGKIKITYLGFDRKISGSIFKMKKPYFVYTGNAYPHKNLKNLIKAIKILNTKTGHPVFLVIASARNIFTQRMEKYIQEEGVKNLVKILGFVPDEKLGAMFKNSVAFTFPSHSEGFGLPGLEALASGTLLLASNIPVFNEIYNGTTLYFDQNRPEAIAQAMEKAILLSREEREKKITFGKSFVKRYSWSKMAEDTLKIYAESCDSLRPCK